MSAKTGIKSVLYYNTGESYGSPTWTAISCVSDLQLGSNWNAAEGATRASRVVLNAKTQLVLELTGKVRASDTDTVYADLVSAALTDEVLDIMVLDGPKDANGTRGYRFDAHVFGASQDQGLGVVVFTDITIKPAIGDNAPKSVLVTTGAPVFSAI